jgi:hypothetical protein
MLNFLHLSELIIILFYYGVVDVASVVVPVLPTKGSVEVFVSGVELLVSSVVVACSFVVLVVGGVVLEELVLLRRESS